MKSRGGHEEIVAPTPYQRAKCPPETGRTGEGTERVKRHLGLSAGMTWSRELDTAGAPKALATDAAGDFYVAHTSSIPDEIIK